MRLDAFIPFVFSFDPNLAGMLRKLPAEDLEHVASDAPRPLVHEKSRRRLVEVLVASLLRRRRNPQNADSYNRVLVLVMDRLDAAVPYSKRRDRFLTKLHQAIETIDSRRMFDDQVNDLLATIDPFFSPSA